MVGGIKHVCNYFEIIFQTLALQISVILFIETLKGMTLKKTIEIL